MSCQPLSDKANIKCNEHSYFPLQSIMVGHESNRVELLKYIGRTDMRVVILTEEQYSKYKESNTLPEIMIDTEGNQINVKELLK